MVITRTLTIEESKMDKIVVFYCTVETRFGEKEFNFTGVGSSVEAAYKRAIQSLKEDEYLKCVHYEVVRVCYGIL